MAKPLHASEGVLLYSTQSTQATAVTPASTLGIAEYNVTDDGDFRQFYTVGKKNLHKNKAGNAKVDWQVRLNGLGDRALLELGIRTSGLLPWITWGFGSDPNDASPEAWQVMDSKVDTMEVSLDGGGILSGSLQGIGGAKTTLTTLTADPGTSNPFMSYEAICTLADAAFEVRSFQFTVNHNLTPDYPIRGMAVSDAQLRLFTHLMEGNEEISGTVTLGRKYTKDFQAKCPAADGDLVLTLLEACDTSNNWSITLDDVEFLRQIRNMPAEGYGSFELPFNAKGIALADLAA
jgi:hypothetical protein